jgi:hypothetical protein
MSPAIPGHLLVDPRVSRSTKVQFQNLRTYHKGAVEYLNSGLEVSPAERPSEL